MAMGIVLSGVDCDGARGDAGAPAQVTSEIFQPVHAAPMHWGRDKDRLHWRGTGI